MKNNSLLILVVVLVIIAIVGVTFRKVEGFWTNLQTSYDPNAPMSSGDSQGDLVLRDIYRQIHNLEAIARNEVAQNNDFPGGSQGIPRERLVMENIAMDIARLKGTARYLIAKNRIPTLDANPPYLWKRDHKDYDTSERILGIPSVPGNNPMYYENSWPYNTGVVPRESPGSEDLIGV